MGPAGRVAGAFLRSKLTPLVAVASLAAGAMAIVATPREEEPQISVPMIDVSVGLPGASPAETENLLVRPIERRMYEIPGVDHVYSTAGDGYALVTVRFRVGEDQEQSVVKVHAKLFSALDQSPPGATQPLVVPHSIDDVPILTLTLHSARYGSNGLRQVGIHLEDEIRTVPDVAETFVTGGEPRQMRVILDPVRMVATGVTGGDIASALRGANARLQAGEIATGDQAYLVRVGAPLATPTDVGGVVVSAHGAPPVYLRDVASVADEFGEPTSYVAHGGPGSREGESAVTISIAKRPGANATAVAHAVLERVERARSRLLPADISIAITRNYGETAREKANELMQHLAIATLSVTVLIGIFLGWREALVVLVAVPVTLSLTLFAYYALGYTLNRITLFALIFSIGILVDDAIVVVENIYRHLQLNGADPETAALAGVDEVGNPTILATFTVIAAILPMAFVSGLMGPYMRPIPVGASVAMLASLGVAFVVTPYLALRLLRGHVGHVGAARQGPETTRGRFAAWYARLMTGLMQQRRHRLSFYGAIGLLLVGSVGLVALRVVSVKMLPFDNKSEFQVILDSPEGTTLETSAALAAQVAAYLRTLPDVESTEAYAGIAAPFNFNGLVRHYFLRRGANVSDIQVNLRPKGERTRQSHAIAVAARPGIDSIARRYGATSAKLAEIPPGPPVLSTLVAEIYASDDDTRLEAARQVKRVFETTPGVVDVDWTVPAPQRQLTLQVDRERAGAAGTSVEQLVQTVAMAQSGVSAGLVASSTSRDAVAIVPRLALEARSGIEALLVLPVATAAGPQPLARFVKVDSTVQASVRLRKDLRPVIYVTGDVAGQIESPVYAILAMNRRLDSVRVNGAQIGRYNATQPDRLDETAMKWDGEWQITLEVFRDLGVAFTAVLVLIYVLVVGWFQSFRIPLVIMAPIPLTLIGILPGHALTGAFFTATSMIGMIALAGIIVRNSILLVDFIQLAEAKGAAVADAVIEAGSVRFRPIALTAAAVVTGGLVMVLDPIFQGLAVALMSGAIVATLLTMVVVPLLYWELRRRERSRS
jgi:multidrug efflux pump subunit AcrB